jgi:hypothetical protein
VRRLVGTLVVAILWSLLVAGAIILPSPGLGNPFLCATDPTCGVDERVPPIVWLIGLGVILVVSYLTRPKRVGS